MRSKTPDHLGRTGENFFTALDEPVYKFICDEFNIKSCLDIGCSVGGTVEHFRKKLGVEARGIDGDYYAINQYAKPEIKEYLYLHDYTKGFSNFDKRVDLVISYDFVEHVDEKYTDNYMNDFIKGDVVVLHTPPQGSPGWHHVNTQDNDYWILLFTSYGFKYQHELTLKARSVSNYINPEHQEHITEKIDPKNNLMVYTK